MCVSPAGLDFSAIYLLMPGNSNDDYVGISQYDTTGHIY